MTTNAKSVPSESEPKIATPSGVPGLNLGAPDGVGVDKIRELLFGNQMQDYDRRFSGLEERFQLKLRELESDTARSQSGVETNIKKQLESLAGQLREEKELRSDADKELAREARDRAQTLEKRIAQLSDQVAQLERDFSERLTQEAQALRDEIRRRGDETRQTMERMFAELSNVKTDRTLLAGLFVEVARCLNQDLAPKAGGKLEKS